MTLFRRLDRGPQARAERPSRNDTPLIVERRSLRSALRAPVEIVTLRLEANGVVRKAELRTHPDAGPDASGAIVHHRDVWLAETKGFVSTPVYARERLRPGNRFAGPAIVEQMDATTLVPPGMTAHVDRWLNLILEAT